MNHWNPVLFENRNRKAACVVSLHQQWTRIAVRVAGSWIAAMGLLMLGWFLRGGN